MYSSWNGIVEVCGVSLMSTRTRSQGKVDDRINKH